MSNFVYVLVDEELDEDDNVIAVALTEDEMRAVQQRLSICRCRRLRTEHRMLVSPTYEEDIECRIKEERGLVQLSWRATLHDAIERVKQERRDGLSTSAINELEALMKKALEPHRVLPKE